MKSEILILVPCFIISVDVFILHGFRGSNEFRVWINTIHLIHFCLPVSPGSSGQATHTHRDRHVHTHTAQTGVTLAWPPCWPPICSPTSHHERPGHTRIGTHTLKDTRAHTHWHNVWSDGYLLRQYHVCGQCACGQRVCLSVCGAVPSAPSHWC